MAEVIFEIRGKRVDPASITNPLEKSVYQSLLSSLRTRFDKVVCPVHKTEPVITVSGPSIDRVSFDVSGCCQQLLDLVQARANG